MNNPFVNLLCSKNPWLASAAGKRTDDLLAWQDRSVKPLVHSGNDTGMLNLSLSMAYGLWHSWLKSGITSFNRMYVFDPLLGTHTPASDENTARIIRTDRLMAPREVRRWCRGSRDRVYIEQTPQWRPPTLKRRCCPDTHEKRIPCTTTASVSNHRTAQLALRCRNYLQEMGRVCKVCKPAM